MIKRIETGQGLSWCAVNVPLLTVLFGELSRSDGANAVV